MDPSSIVTASLSLTGGIAKASLVLSQFVHDCRAAADDVDAICHEMQLLTAVLDTLSRSISRQRDDPLSEALVLQVSNTISGCAVVVEEIEQTIEEYGHDGVWISAKWAMFGKDDIHKLHEGLEVYTMALSIGLHAISLNTGEEIQGDTDMIQSYIEALRLNRDEVLARVNSIGERGPSVRNQTRLDQWIEQMAVLSSYAESTYKDTVVDHEEPAMNQTSPSLAPVQEEIPVTEEQSTSPSLPTAPDLSDLSPATSEELDESVTDPLEHISPVVRHPSTDNTSANGNAGVSVAREPPLPSPASTPSSPMIMAKVLYDFSAQQENELSILAGELVEIVEKKNSAYLAKVGDCLDWKPTLPEVADPKMDNSWEKGDPTPGAPVQHLPAPPYDAQQSLNKTTGGSSQRAMLPRNFASIRWLVALCAVSITASWLFKLGAVFDTPLTTSPHELHHVLKRFEDSLQQCKSLKTFPSRLDPQNRTVNPRWNRVSGQQRPVVLTNATFFDGTSVYPEPMDITFEKGLITRLAPTASSLTSAGFNALFEIYNVHLRFVTPGLVDMHSHHSLGVWPDTGGANDDVNEMQTEWGPMTPFVRVLDGLKAYDEAFMLIASGGITSSLILPGSANIMGGEGFAVKNARNSGEHREYVVEETLLEYGVPEEQRVRYMKLACGENPKDVYGHTRMGNAWILRAHLAKARELLTRQDDYCLAASVASTSSRSTQHDFVKAAGKFPAIPELESTVALLRGRVAFHNHCYLPEDMETMIRVTSEQDIKIKAFHHAIEAWQVPHMLKRKAENITIATFAEFSLYKWEAYSPSLAAGKILNDHGIPVAFKSDHGIAETNAKYLAYQAGVAHAFRLPEDKALQSITSIPAKALDLDYRIGYALPGYDADIVVWDSHPLAIGATPLQVFIDGVPQLESSKVKRSMGTTFKDPPSPSSGVPMVPPMRSLTTVTASLGMTEIVLSPDTGNGLIEPTRDAMKPENINFAKYGVQLQGKAFSRARMGGITRAVSPPTCMGGFLLGSDVGLHITLDSSAKLTYGTIGNSIAKLRKLITDGHGFLNATVFGEVATGKLPLIIHANNHWDIQQVIAVKMDFPSTKLVILGGAEAPLLSQQTIASMPWPWKLVGQQSMLGSTMLRQSV
ncbi:hypothetical protein G7Z17_g1641 [Cylindrodendrum hubeiense]|uniref:Amidohydrolase-related domain-containing protein n=1 Tax=Cylindrodendrum hubeiense TaxID=595255 RepID=A0A9P5LF70_9HYPO|nr:hypothetical protein G7Z17_g1641 [Cylindrodendrum hubeiense]